MNNTLTEGETSKDKAKETEKSKEAEIYSDKHINTTKESESVAGKDINTWQKNTTADGKKDKHTDTIPEKTVAGDRNEGEKEINTGSEKPTEGSKDKVDSKDPDNSLNTVVVKTPEKKEGSPDTILDTGKTEIVVIKDKGQEEKERKEEQVNGKRDPDKVGPNDTKQRTIISEAENTLEIFELDMTPNNTVTYDTKVKTKENNTIGSTEPKLIPTRINITQYTMYRAGGEESGTRKEKPTGGEDKAKDSAERTKDLAEMEREVKEKEEKDKEKVINQSFTGKIIFY